jgi:hypothetical protein
LNHWTQKRPWHMTLKIHVLVGGNQYFLHEQTILSVWHKNETFLIKFACLRINR